jgi:hypothetical protein
MGEAHEQRAWRWFGSPPDRLWASHWLALQCLARRILSSQRRPKAWKPNWPLLAPWRPLDLSSTSLKRGRQGLSASWRGPWRASHCPAEWSDCARVARPGGWSGDMRPKKPGVLIAVAREHHPFCSAATIESPSLSRIRISAGQRPLAAPVSAGACLMEEPLLRAA